MNVAGTGMRVVVATRPVDFRKGHDGLAAVVEHELGLDAHSSDSDQSFQSDSDHRFHAFRSPASLRSG